LLKTGAVPRLGRLLASESVDVLIPVVGTLQECASLVSWEGGEERRGRRGGRRGGREGWEGGDGGEGEGGGRGEGERGREGMRRERSWEKKERELGGRKSEVSWRDGGLEERLAGYIPRHTTEHLLCCFNLRSPVYYHPGCLSGVDPIRRHGATFGKGSQRGKHRTPETLRFGNIQSELLV
jgi:hypothetical protein